MLGPLGNGYRLDVERPLLVGGGIGVAPLPYLSDALGHPPAILGFRSDWHAEAAHARSERGGRGRTDLRHRGDPRPARTSSPAGRSRCSQRSSKLEPDRPARLGSADGLRLRRLLRLRSRDSTGSSSGSASKGPCSRRRRLPREHPERLGLPRRADGAEGGALPGCVRHENRDATATRGNAPPRIAEVEHGMLNSIGLANPGIDRFLAHTLPRLAELEVPIWVSVGGFAVAEYADLCDRLDDRPEVEAIELNVSCPNVDDVPASVGEIVAASRAATRKPLYTKLYRRRRTSPRSHVPPKRRARTGSRSSTRSSASLSTSRP